jgi:hypothetical protein
MAGSAKGGERVLYEHEATVEVNGAFPVDMLRYDRCYPASEEDAKAIAQSLARPRREPHRVTVKALSPSREHWTRARWRSFGALIVKTVAQKRPTGRKA